tara:strand:+ start:1252 stop:2322 length:1071 start_codon:yes stop_codon:yes gene_type:complete
VNKNKLLIFLSIIFSLFIIEIFCIFFLSDKRDYNYQNRYMLFSEGKNFRNIDNFFTYYPNQKINVSNYYFKNDDFIKVYNYNIYTNNLGLVQKKNLNKDTPSILFLGDSFTEGQGAESWIDNFDGVFKKYQIINGGLLGTGFQQFELMNNYLKDYNIKKVLILFIGDDLRRDVFQFNEQQIKCLKDYTSCLGFENFYGFPLSNRSPELFLNELRKKQIVLRENNQNNFKSIRRNLKKKITSLNIIKIPNNFLKSKFYSSKNEKILRNFESINNLIKIYNENIHFVHIRMKDEIINKKNSYESIYAKKYITNLSKNFYKCSFNNNLDYFYEYDSHPNEKGYDYLYSCILDILENQNL